MAIDTLLYFTVSDGRRGVGEIPFMSKTKPPDLRPVSQAEVEALNVRPREGGAPLERGEDLLERYIKIPNHMMFLYSSEDDLLSGYITNNWAALDSMSGELCDIYTSMLQLSGEEDVYSFIDDLYYIPGAQSVRIDKLPIILLWSDSASLCISLSDFSGDFPTIRRIVRGTFQCLYEIGGGVTLEHEGKFRSMLEAAYVAKDGSGSSYTVNVDRRIIMSNNEYKADRGGVVLGDGAKARDIIVKQNLSESSIDLEKLSGELASLRKAMKSDVDSIDPAHDIAIGQIAVAEHAAKSGNLQSTITALSSAGKWALQVAEKIGVGLAVTVIKDSMHQGHL